jgi:uncharacterized protein (DUF1499 family)
MRGTGRRVGPGLRRALVVAGVVLTLLLGAGLVSSMIWPVINDVSTGETPEYPELQPQILRYSPDLVVERSVEAVEGLERWTLGAVDREARRVEAVATTALFGFDDDVTITVRPHGAGSLVHVRSRSRVGRGDFGQNARNVRAFQGALEERLSLARPNSGETP